MQDTHRLPLFPLGIVILPGMTVPLHIFEERYKQMIADCLDSNHPFGIVLFDGQSIHSAGCTAYVTEVTQTYDDGRMDILVRGDQRFLVRDMLEEKLYMEAFVTFFDDQEEAPGGDHEVTIRSAHLLLEELLSLDPDAIATPIPDPGDLGDFSFAIAALDGFTPAERQTFLEMTSASERLQRSVDALASLVQRLRLTKEIHRVIGGNGHPPKSLISKLFDVETH
jgi:Lon protease-like protein